jgi:hypothetical protein
MQRSPVFTVHGAPAARDFGHRVEARLAETRSAAEAPARVAAATAGAPRIAARRGP